MDEPLGESDGQQPSPADVLRDHFGGHRAPDITRKITACVACRKQKVKCYMRDSQPPCTRCKKRGLSCTVNKSLQTLLESDIVWKEAVQQKLQRLEDVYGRIAQQLGIPDVIEHEVLASSSSQPHQAAPSEQLNTGDHEMHNWAIVMDPNSGPGVIPGSVVSPLVSPELSGNRGSQDIISRGILTEEAAYACLNVYQNRLDHFVYGIVGEQRTLGQIRKSSPLLLAAICAVGSLHQASSDFDKLYQEFVTAASTQLFARGGTTDDVRALCIGAFWLSGISWACVSAAVRVSTEIQLHRSIFKAIEGSEAHYLRTRLYYLVFVCAHHFSIPYGRPPMTPVCEAIRANAAFLGSNLAVENDARLVSQVRFWQVGAQVLDHFGVDVDRPLTLSMIEPLRRFSIQFDNIRADWSERFLQNQYVLNYPRKGVNLHYHFAKLQLFSHAFRGIDQPEFKAADISMDIDELANAGMLSATSILKAVVSDTEIQGYLNGLPTYFDLMIAFAVVFVLKVSSRYAGHVQIDTTEAQNLVSELVDVLKHVTSAMHPRHLLASVAKGAEVLLQHCRVEQATGDVAMNNQASTMDGRLPDETMYNNPPDWNEFSLEHFTMTELDFLSGQNLFNNFEPQVP